MGTNARAVIIGGGVMGCALAYHLSRAGWRDIVLLEQHELTEGTTWHTAGFVTSLRGPEGPAWHARLAGYLPALSAMLRAESGRDAGWRGVGGLRLALSHPHVDELRRLARRADELGVPLELRGASATMALAPRLDLTDVQAAAWLPGEGFIRPKDFVAALAAGATAHGATVRTGVRVTGIDVVDGAVRAVRTDDGTIATTLVVNAAGAAAGAVGALAGVTVPVVPINHQYGVTQVLHPVLDPDNTPTCRVPEQGLYLRAANGSLIVGGPRPDLAAAWPAGDSEPLAKAKELVAPDAEAFAPVWELARRRMPELSRVELAKLMHGVEAFTPDGAPLVGPSPVQGMWIAAGFGLHGMALAGGVGRHLAEWITTGAPSWDLGALLPDRFGTPGGHREWITSRAIDTLRRS